MINGVIFDMDGVLIDSETIEKKNMIKSAEINSLPFEDDSLDLVTAFETVYFWPDIEQTFAGIRRVLKPDGVFFICNESNGHDKEALKYSKIIDGMTLYDADQLTDLLKEAGFRDVVIDINGVWLCVKAVC